MYDKSIIIFEKFLKDYDCYNIRKTFVNNDNNGLLAFANNQDNKKKYINTFNSIMDIYYNSEYSGLFYYLNFVLDNIDIEKYSKNKKIMKYLLCLSQCVIVVEIMIKLKKSMISTMTLNELYNNNDNLLKSNELYIYRGQSDYTWRLIPSMFRNLRENVLIDKRFMFIKYKNLHLSDKYKNIVDNKYDINYDFLSFMQHSCAYSPFIDFTHSKIVGISFSLSNKNSFNDFHNKPSGLFIVVVDKKYLLNKKEDIDNFINNEYKITYLNRNTIGFGEPISYYDNGEYKQITFTTFETLIEVLTPKYKILDLPINDRMKYQQGLFIVFYDCISINGEIFYELNKEFKFVNLKIKVSDKDKFLPKIYKDYRFYDPEHLMNPYLYFNE